jgi:hypothetical protein
MAQHQHGTNLLFESSILLQATREQKHGLSLPWGVTFDD